MERRYSLRKNDDFNTTSIVARQTDHVQNQALQLSEKREGFLVRLFPDAKQREIIKGELALVKTEYDFRKRALDTLRETQLQVLTETCNQLLIQFKTERRATTAQFLLHKKEELTRELDMIFERFMKLMEAKCKSIENEPNSLLRRVREDKLDKDLSDFMNLHDKLTDKFNHLVDEEVNY